MRHRGEYSWLDHGPMCQGLYRRGLHWGEGESEAEDRDTTTDRQHDEAGTRGEVVERAAGDSGGDGQLGSVPAVFASSSQHGPTAKPSVDRQHDETEARGEVVERAAGDCGGDGLLGSVPAVCASSLQLGPTAKPPAATAAGSQAGTPVHKSAGGPAQAAQVPPAPGQTARLEAPANGAATGSQVGAPVREEA